MPGFSTPKTTGEKIVWKASSEPSKRRRSRGKGKKGRQSEPAVPTASSGQPRAAAHSATSSRPAGTVTRFPGVSTAHPNRESASVGPIRPEFRGKTLPRGAITGPSAPTTASFFTRERWEYERDDNPLAFRFGGLLSEFTQRIAHSGMSRRLQFRSCDEGCLQFVQDHGDWLVAKQHLLDSLRRERMCAFDVESHVGKEGREPSYVSFGTATGYAVIFPLRQWSSQRMLPAELREET